MTSPPDHLQMVSLRGEEYVFELKGMMPDGLIEVYRQLYMDSFLIFVLPVDVENIKYFRAWSVREALNFCTDLRLHSIPSDLLSMKIDKIVWESMFTEYLPEGQAMPAFPWRMPRRDPAAPPSPILQAWWRKMGLSCEDETLMDSSSTDSVLHNVERLLTQEKVEEFLEEQQLTQWYTTRATLPKKPVKQGSRVSRRERSASRGRAWSRSRAHSRASSHQRSLAGSESEVDVESEIWGRHRSPHSSHGRSYGGYSAESRYHRSPSRREYRRNRSRSPSRYEHRRNRSRSPSRYEHRRYRSRSPRPQGTQHRRATPSRSHEESVFPRSERREQNSSSHPATSTTLPGGWESTLRPALVDYFGTNSQTTSDGTYKLCAIDNSLGGGPQSNIYTSSQDVATGQALYHMVKGDPKLRDVSIIIMEGALQRQSRSDGFSYGFSVHIRPVYGRISKRDPYKLLFNSKARARSDKKSYEVIEDDIVHAPDPSMGRDEQAHRMNVEPIRESPDMNMTGSTLAGLSSAIEAQSDATAPATTTSSNNQGGSKVAADMESTNLHVPEGSK